MSFGEGLRGRAGRQEEFSSREVANPRRVGDAFPIAAATKKSYSKKNLRAFAASRENFPAVRADLRTKRHMATQRQISRTVAMALKTCSISASVCVALRLNLSLAVPRGTVGNRIAGT